MTLHAFAQRAIHHATQLQDPVMEPVNPLNNMHQYRGDQAITAQNQKQTNGQGMGEQTAQQPAESDPDYEAVMHAADALNNGSGNQSSQAPPGAMQAGIGQSNPQAIQFLQKAVPATGNGANHLAAMLKAMSNPMIPVNSISPAMPHTVNPQMIAPSSPYFQPMPINLTAPQGLAAFSRRLS